MGNLTNFFAMNESEMHRSKALYFKSRILALLQKTITDRNLSQKQLYNSIETRNSAIDAVYEGNLDQLTIEDIIEIFEELGVRFNLPSAL